MGYQALLFSTDERASRAVQQILSELDFSVELCSEPFDAVKQITSQHFDAIVVDCDHEQNATLLFKSARNSTSNNASLAVALVQGQGGIAKAFRIGANLVLTKPIHVEQSKGTLRTARGLLRQAEAAKSATTPVLAPAPQAPADLQPELSPSSVIASAAAAGAQPALMTNSEFSVGTIAAAALELQAEEFPKLGASEAALLESLPEPEPVRAAPSSVDSVTKETGAKPGTKTSAAQASASMAGAAAAPARALLTGVVEPATPEVAAQKPGSAATEKKSSEAPPVPRRTAFAKSSAASTELPEFDEPKPGDAKPPETANKKNLLIAALLVLAVAGAVFYGWPQLEPLVSSLPIVQKYFGAPQAPPSSAVPAPAPAAPKPETGTAAPSSSGPESTAQPQAPAVAGQTTAPQGSAPVAPASSTPAAATPASQNSANPAQHASPLHLAPEVAAGLLTEKTDPVYPPSALQNRIEGPVKLQAEIGKDGTTSNIKVISGQKPLGAAAIAAVRQWKYKPYQVNGQATEFQTEITVDFKLP